MEPWFLGSRLLRMRRCQLLFDPLRGAVQTLAEILTQLVAGLGREEQCQRAADQGAERERAKHGEGGIVGGALLEPDPGEHVIPFRKVRPHLLRHVLQAELREILECHHYVLRSSNAPRMAEESTLPAMALPPVMTSNRTALGVSPPPST